MSRFIVILALFAFLAGGLAESAHAAFADMACSHQTIDMNSPDQDCADNQTQDQADLNDCQDCCCHHTHVIGKITPNASAQIDFKTSMVFAPNEAPRSRVLSPLYRPPIA